LFLFCFSHMFACYLPIAASLRPSALSAHALTALSLSRLSLSLSRLSKMPTVFKKDVQIKSDQKLSGKDAKKIIASVQALYGEEASSMLGKKDVSLRRTGGGTVATLYCSEAGPLFFEAEGDAGGAGGASLLPTLLALWRAPLLPTLLVPAPVSAFLVNHADLMLPGVLGYENWRDGLNAGDVACIAVHGNPAPLALGRLLVSGAAVTASLSL